MKQTCLEPYRTVAADWAEFYAGEVLFFPELVGVRLPDGQIHDGYMIVRDHVALLDNEGGTLQMLFFTGAQTEQDAKNPFVALGFSEPDGKIKYRRVFGGEADSIRKKRHYAF